MVKSPSFRRTSFIGLFFSLVHGLTAPLLAAEFYWNPESLFVTSTGASFNAAGNWSSNPDGSGIRPRSIQDDYFPGSALNTAVWTALDSTANKSGTFSVGNNSLTLTAASGDLWLGDNDVMTVYRTDIKGDFDVMVHVKSLDTADEWTKAGFLIWNDFTNFGKGGGLSVALTGNRNVVMQRDSVAPQGQIDYTIMPPVSKKLDSCWLRVIRKGIIFHSYYRVKATDPWIRVDAPGTALGTVANTPSQIGLFISAHNEGGATVKSTVVFDQFQAGTLVDDPTIDLTIKGTSKTKSTKAFLTENLAARNLNFDTSTVSLDFGADTLALSGNAALNKAKVLPGTGGLVFSGKSGFQDLTYLDVTGRLPAILKSDSSVLRLNSTLRAHSLLLKQGALDFNNVGLDLLGNLDVRQGLDTTLLNYKGKSWLIGGDATFTGKPDDTLIVNPGAAFTLKVAGKLTADYAHIGFSNATGSIGYATQNCVNEGGNSRWIFGSQTVPKIQGATGDTTVTEGAAAFFTVHATGGGLTYAWRKFSDTTVLSTDSTLTLSPATTAMQGTQYQCTVTNFYGKVVSAFATLTVIQKTTVTKAPKDTLVLAGSNASFSVTATGTAPLTYAWHLQGDTTTLSTTSTLQLPAVTASDSGKSYFCVIKSAFDSVVSTAALLRVVVPARVQKEPQDFAGILGQKVAFGLVAAGTAPLSIQWFRVGQTAPIPNAISDSLFLDTAKISDTNAVFYAIVSNAYGKDTTAKAKLTLNSPPSIAAQPKDTTVAVGSSATFKIIGAGSGTLAYAWYRKGQDSVLGTQSNLVLSKVELSDDGAEFYCVISNEYGSTRSREALLTLAQPLFISTEPKDLLIETGLSGQFSVGVSGERPLTYRWRQVGDTTVLSTDSVLNITAFQSKDIGKKFQVIVSNRTGSDTSRAASWNLSACLPTRIIRVDTLKVNEGDTLRLAGNTLCALKYRWKVLSGTPPALVNPDSANQTMIVPKVGGDTQWKFQFDQFLNPDTLSNQVLVLVHGSQAAPQFEMIAFIDWHSESKLVLRPFTYAPADSGTGANAKNLRYLWSLSGVQVDTVQSGDSISISNPKSYGELTVTLCLDNAGAKVCKMTTVNVIKSSSIMGGRLAFMGGPIQIRGESLFWKVPAAIQVWNSQGKSIWSQNGKRGGSMVMPREVHHLLRHNQGFYRIQVLP